MQFYFNDASHSHNYLSIGISPICVLQFQDQLNLRQDRQSLV